MDTFLVILALVGLFLLLAFLPLVWYLKDRAVDRRVHRAAQAHREPPVPEALADLPLIYVRATRIPLRPRYTVGRAH